jgi:hypothetical protein
MVDDVGSSLSDMKAVCWRWGNLGQLQHSNRKQYMCSGVRGHRGTVNDRLWLSWEWSVQWHDSGDTNTQATWSHPDLSEPGMEGQKMVLKWVIVEDWHPRHWDSVVLYQHLPAGTEEVMANCSQCRDRRLLHLWWGWCGGSGGEHPQCWVELQNWRFW